MVLVWFVLVFWCGGLFSGFAWAGGRGLALWFLGLLVTSVIFCDYGWFGGGLWGFSGG